MEPEPVPLQMLPPREVMKTRGGNPYSWVSQEVLTSPSRVTKEYLVELSRADIVFLLGHASEYRLVAPHPSERICFANNRVGDKPDFLWVYDSMFTRIGVRIPFTIFQQEVLIRCAVAPSQLHPNRGERLFDLYWRVPGKSAHPKEYELSKDELDVARILGSLWGEENLDLKVVIGDENAARVEVEKMSGGLATLVNLRRRILSEPPSQGAGKSVAANSVNIDLTSNSVSPEDLDPENVEDTGINKRSPEVVVTSSPL
ncbi:hypothetical protein PIB30_033894 [Stylosanthes scabra]|uniref:Uncharacterized protein n=1 Tax=Stylosanthes scabra TaxID=79078 RepID=A0ABU6UBE4_9FABA|nr:hypothetical protein [Stylosanthes scabra]